MPRTVIPQTMTAVEIREPGPPQVLRAVERPVPEAGAGEVLIRVAAAGVNRPDVLQRKGLYPPPAGVTDIPGLEVAGEVVHLGPDVREPQQGARVCALVAGGARGIGTTAILLGKAFDARMIVTAGSAQKCSACRELGAELAINYHEVDFVEATLRATEGTGADVILDMVGGDYLARNVAAAGLEGRIALIATQGGTKAELDLRPLMAKRLTITASTLRSQPGQNKGRLARTLRENVWPLFASHGLKPVIHSRFPLADAALAHKLMESDLHIGKIVLVV